MCFVLLRGQVCLCSWTGVHRIPFLNYTPALDPRVDRSTLTATFTNTRYNITFLGSQVIKQSVLHPRAFHY